MQFEINETNASPQAISEIMQRKEYITNISDAMPLIDQMSKAHQTKQKIVNVRIDRPNAKILFNTALYNPTFKEFIKILVDKYWFTEQKQGIHYIAEHGAYSTPIRFFWHITKDLTTAGFEVNYKWKAISIDLRKAREKFNEKYELWEWQLEADHALQKSGYRGVIEASSGSGKTILGIHEILQLSVRTAIIVPTEVLAQQWEYELNKIGIEPGLYYGKIKDIKDITIFIINSAAKWIPQRPEWFSFIIEDECHHGGSYIFSQAHDHLAPYALGISATVEREDQRHEQHIYHTIGERIYELSVPHAIQKGYLARLKAVNIRYQLAPDEWKQYVQIDPIIRRIMARYAAIAGDRNPFIVIQREAKMKDSTALKCLKLIAQRKNILEKSVAKIPIIEEIIVREPTEKWIVFCELIEQAEAITKHLSNRFAVGVFHSKLNKKERETTLTRFETGTINVLVAVKCIEESECVTIQDPEGNTEVLTLKELGERYLFNSNYRDFPVSEAAPKILSANLETMEPTWTPIKHITRRQANQIYELEFSSGRRLKATPDHRFFILKNGRIYEKQAQNLTKHDYIIIPHRTPQGERTTQIIENAFPLDKNLARLLGYYTAEGCLTFGGNYKERSVTLFCYGENARAKKQTITTIKELIPNIHIQDYPDKRELRICSIALAKLLQPCGHRATQKTVHPAIFNSPKEIQGKYLEGLIEDGDGNHSKRTKWNTPFTQLTTVSKKLAVGVSHILASHEINSAIYEGDYKSNVTDNAKRRYVLTVTGYHDNQKLHQLIPNMIPDMTPPSQRKHKLELLPTEETGLRKAYQKLHPKAKHGTQCILTRPTKTRDFLLRELPYVEQAHPNHQFTKSILQNASVLKLKARRRHTGKYTLYDIGADGNFTVNNNILAHNCLDEGYNVPECKRGIISGGSSTKRQIIQRVGRLLRELSRLGGTSKDAVLYQLYAGGTKEEDYTKRRTKILKPEKTEWLKWSA